MTSPATPCASCAATTCARRACGSRAPRLRSLLLALALVASEAAAETISIGDGIPATLLKPQGNGPFPAVVMLHDCSGLGPRSSGAPGRWTKELVSQGYAVILPDSFSTRG